MKLLFLTEFYPRDEHLVFTGGVEARVYYVSRLAKKDFAVAIIASNSGQIPATAESIFSRLVYMVSAFFRALAAEFDLIEASNVVTYLPAYLAAKIKGKPAIAWIPDVLGKHWWEFGPVVGFFGLLAEKICLSLNWTRVIALSQSTASKLIAGGVDPKKITVIHAGIDLEEFK